MDLEIIILSEGSQIEKGKCHITPSFLKMIQMNLFTKQKQTYRYWKQTYGYQRWKDGKWGKIRALKLILGKKEQFIPAEYPHGWLISCSVPPPRLVSPSPRLVLFSMRWQKETRRGAWQCEPFQKVLEESSNLAPSHTFTGSSERGCSTPWPLLGLQR